MFESSFMYGMWLMAMAFYAGEGVRVMLKAFSIVVSPR